MPPFDDDIHLVNTRPDPAVLERNADVPAENTAAPEATTGTSFVEELTSTAEAIQTQVDAATALNDAAERARLTTTTAAPRPPQRVTGSLFRNGGAVFLDDWGVGVAPTAARRCINPRDASDFSEALRNLLCVRNGRTSQRLDRIIDAIEKELLFVATGEDN